MLIFMKRGFNKRAREKEIKFKFHAAVGLAASFQINIILVLSSFSNKLAFSPSTQRFKVIATILNQISKSINKQNKSLLILHVKFSVNYRSRWKDARQLTAH